MLDVKNLGYCVKMLKKNLGFFRKCSRKSRIFEKMLKKNLGFLRNAQEYLRFLKIGNFVRMLKKYLGFFDAYGLLKFSRISTRYPKNFTMGDLIFFVTNLNYWHYFGINFDIFSGNTLFDIFNA